MDGIPPFMLEVSSPGLSTTLSSDQDFLTFKGFDVQVETSEPHKGKTVFTGLPLASSPSVPAGTS